MDGVVLCVFVCVCVYVCVECMSLLLGILKSKVVSGIQCVCKCVGIRVWVRGVCMAITLYVFLLRGQGSAFCYPGHTVLSSFLYLYLCVCVSACTCVDVVVSLLITICFSLTVWSGKAPRPAAHNTLFWSPGSTVCLAPQWG